MTFRFKKLSNIVTRFLALIHYVGDIYFTKQGGIYTQSRALLENKIDLT